MNVLVTGASGFTGKALSKRLISEGNEVTAFVRKPETCADLMKMGAKIAQGTVEDRESVFRTVKGAEIVFHIAALFRKAGFPDSGYYKVNVEGTQNLLDASVREGVKRFVHCSTIGVCGHIENPPADENTPYNPGDIYQITKMEGEKLALEYSRQGKLPVSIIRPASIYGPGDLRLLKMFRLIKKRRFIVFGDGSPFFHPVYINDLVQGFILAGMIDRAVGEVFIIAGGEYVRLNELFRIIADTLGVKPPRITIPAKPVQVLGTIAERIFIPLKIEPPIYRRRVDFFTKSRAFRIDKAKNLLGYSPEVDLASGIRITAEWYRKEGLL